MTLDELVVAHAGPVIAAAAGPGLVGFALFPVSALSEGGGTP